MDRPDFNLSDPEHIKRVKNNLVEWMTKNKYALYEVNRAIAMMLRESDEKRQQNAMERRQH